MRSERGPLDTPRTPSPRQTSPSDDSLMADSHLRRLSQPHRHDEPDLESEAAFRAKRDAERAAQERADALERVRAHRKEAAQTRALRPANVVPPEEANQPAPQTQPVPAQVNEPSVETSEVRVAGTFTGRPSRDTKPIRQGRLVPPPVPTRPSPTASGRVQQLLEAVGEAERRLLANDVPGALDVLGRAKRG